MGSTTPRLITAAGIVALCSLSWGYLVWVAEIMAGGGGMSASAGPSAATAWTGGELAWTFVMWTVMMAAMMLPSALPMVLTFAAVAGGHKAAPGWRLPTACFSVGYLIAWMAFSLAASLAQWTLYGSGLLSLEMRTTNGFLGGAILLAAGAFQFTPLKRACLRKCRTPLGFIMSEWRTGPLGAAVMGARHGVYCVGCCWALMAVLFVVGVMSLLWVVALSVLVLVEKAVPVGESVARISGIALALLGLWHMAS